MADDNVRAAMAPLVSRRDGLVVLLDFDGTLSAIVTEPDAARLWPGFGDVLAGLLERGVAVNVISGRPVAFLRRQLGALEPLGLGLVGLHGLEASGVAGHGHTAEDLAGWRRDVSAMVAELHSRVPDGVLVEDKDIVVTVHWRKVPHQADDLEALVSEMAGRFGFVTHPGRLSCELRPPVDRDKGTVVEALALGYSAVLYAGDDLGDLPAFAAIHRWRTATGGTGLCLAVKDGESAPGVLEAADVVVDGPGGLMTALQTLLADPPG